MNTCPCTATCCWCGYVRTVGVVKYAMAGYAVGDKILLGKELLRVTMVTTVEEPRPTERRQPDWQQRNAHHPRSRKRFGVLGRRTRYV